MRGWNDDKLPKRHIYIRGPNERRQPAPARRAAWPDGRGSWPGAGRDRQRAVITDGLVIALFFFANSLILGPLVVVGQLAVLAALLLLHRELIVALSWRALPILAIGIWATASAFWSVDPGVSARYGSQLLITFFIGVFVAEVVPASRLPLLILISTSAVLVLSVLSGRLGQSDVGPVLIGLTGSKNAFAYVCLLNAMSAIAVLAGAGSTKLFSRLAALAMLLLACFLLARGQAASAQVQFVLGSILLASFVWATHVRRATRIFVLTCIFIGGVGAVAAIPQITELSAQFRSDVLKKDATLTGRTYLWQKADDLISQRPGLGWGYRSMWLGSTSETIGLLRWAKITDGRGFNFHNTARELRVDLGFLGPLLFFAPLFLAIGILCKKMVVAPSVEAAFALVVLLLIGAVRAQTETVFAAFGADTILLATLAYHSFYRARGNEAQKQWRRA